jgi:hypothetical protein
VREVSPVAHKLHRGKGQVQHNMFESWNSALLEAQISLIADADRVRRKRKEKRNLFDVVGEPPFFLLKTGLVNSYTVL